MLGSGTLYKFSHVRHFVLSWAPGFQKSIFFFEKTGSVWKWEKSCRSFFHQLNFFFPWAWSIGLMQGKLNWPNLVSKNRAEKVTWKTRRANRLETPGFRRNLGFSPKTWPYWPTNSGHRELPLRRLRRLFIPSVSFNLYGQTTQYSTWVAYENEEPTRPQQSNFSIRCCW
jgi:hypothetical protein